MNDAQAIRALEALGYDKHGAMAMLDEAHDWGVYANGDVTVLGHYGDFTILAHASRWTA